MNFLKNKRNINILFYISLFLLSFLIVFIRFPNAFFYPNFYAEDGLNFTMNIVNNGFISSILTRFNGYYIFGLYILTYFSFLISKISIGGFLVLPKIISLVSYAFLSFVFTLPVLLFKDKIKKPVLVLIVLFSSFIPMIGADHAVIGTIGNLKFAFSYIAFLFILYRLTLPSDSNKNILVDIFIALCAYTNPTVYFLVIPIYFKHIKFIFMEKFNFKRIKEIIIKDVSFISSIFLGLILLIQIAIIYFNGLPTLVEGYLDAPFNFSRTVEIFINRSYIYSFIYPFYGYFNDILSISLLASFVYLIYKYTKNKSLYIYFYGFYSIFITTFIFVINRTGVSSLFMGYKLPGGPAQFFYAQNLIFIFLIFIFLNKIIEKFHKKRIIVYGIIFTSFLLLLVLVPFSGSFGKNNFMQQVGVFSLNAKESCRSNNDNLIKIDIYPINPWNMYIPRNLVCNENMNNYKPDFVSFGLVPYNNNHIGEIKKEVSFSQTFISPYDNLTGINIYISTFFKKIITPYNLIIKDSTCTKIIRSVSLDVNKISDNKLFEIYFNPIKNSLNKTYCFTVITNDNVVATPITLQLSQPDIYKNGVFNINGENKKEDIVFQLLYKKVGGIFHDIMQ